MFWNSQTNADKEEKLSVKKLVFLEEFEKSMLEFKNKKKRQYAKPMHQEK